MTRPPSSSARGRVVATPLARKVARERGLALERIAGSGLAGRITRRDVAALVDRDRPGELVWPATGPTPGVVGEKEVMETVAPWTKPVPTAWMLIEVDLTGLERETPVTTTEGRAGRRDAIIARLPRAIARALRAFPVVNSAWVGGGIHLRPTIITLAVEEPSRADALPVLLPDPDRLTLADVSARLQGSRAELVARESATFTLTLTGAATAATLAQRSIPPGQAACLIVGEPARRLVAEGDTLAIREIAMLGILFDHRVMDGAPAARFLAAVRDAWSTDEAPIP